MARDSDVTRKIAAVKMNALFTAVRTAQKESPNQWGRDKRTDVNDQIKLIQSAFDRGDYAGAVKRSDSVAADFRIRV